MKDIRFIERALDCREVKGAAAARAVPVARKDIKDGKEREN